MGFFTRHKQITGILLIPALLLAWLSFSCQSCYADSETETVQIMHAAMDCCPSGVHAMDDKVENQNCYNYSLIKQPLLADESAVQLADFQDVKLSVSSEGLTIAYPSLLQSTVLDSDPHYFSDRLFSSYRILLI